MLNSPLKSFQISNGVNSYDYRLPGKINPSQLKQYFTKLGCTRIKFSPPTSRHLTGQLCHPVFGLVFLKLSTSPGMDITTRNELDFYRAVTNQDRTFCPRVISSGSAVGRFYYLSELLPGELLVSAPSPAADITKLQQNLDQVFSLANAVSRLTPWFGTLDQLKINSAERFESKWRAWYSDIPQSIKKKYNLAVVAKEITHLQLNLSTTPRHGDFAPWHFMLLPGGVLKLFDGERAMSESPAGYDLAFLIQRVWSVLAKPQLAHEIYHLATTQTLLPKVSFRACLLARSLGGFLDESLVVSPSYTRHQAFSAWVLSRGKQLS